MYRFFFPARVLEDSDDDDDDLDDVHVEGGGPPGAPPGGANVPLAPGAVSGDVKAPEPQVNNLGSCWLSDV